SKNRRRQRRAASPEGTRRRSSHSSAGTRAMAMIRAAVTGRKNSAPARSANGIARITPAPMIRAMEASSRSRRQILLPRPTSSAGASEARGRIERFRPGGSAGAVSVSLSAGFFMRGQCPTGGRLRRPNYGGKVVPLARLERALLAELDFESSASTNSATGARERHLEREGAGRNGSSEDLRCGRRLGIRAEAIGTARSLDEIKDEQPDPAYDRNQRYQNPPARFVLVVQPSHGNCEVRDENRQTVYREQDARNAERAENGLKEDVGRDVIPSAIQLNVAAGVVIGDVIGELAGRSATGEIPDHTEHRDHDEGEQDAGDDEVEQKPQPEFEAPRTPGEIGIALQRQKHVTHF